MKILVIYKWLAGSANGFTSHFKNNEELYNQAKNYWEKLDDASVILLIIFLVLGIAMAVSYYIPYNNRPGRHYTPTHWLYFLVGTFGLTFLLTWCFLFFGVPSGLHGVGMLHFKLALCNAIYATALYFVISWIWCQFQIPTNAFRFLKI